MSSAGTATVGVRILLMDGASAGFGALGAAAQQLGWQFSQLASVWKTLSPVQQDLAVTTAASGLVFAGFAAALADVIDQGSQLGMSLTDMDLAVQGANQDSQQLSDTLIGVANNSLYTSSTVAQGFDILGEHGQSATDITNGVGQAMVNLAEAVQSQPVPAAELLGQTLQGFNIDASQAEQTADLLTGAFYNGQPSVTGLQQALIKVEGEARTLKIPLTDILTALDFLGQAGFTGAQAGTALYNMLKNLTDPTAKAESALASLGLMVVNETSPALLDLYNKVDALESKNSKFTLDGTVGSLKQLYDGAKKFDLLGSDDSFYTWALKNGFLSDSFFSPATGNFNGLKQAIDSIAQSLQGLPPDVQLAKIEDIFNVRGSQGVDILVSNLAQLDPLWAKIQTNIKNASASQDAAQRMNTLAGATQALGTTFADLAGKIGLTLSPALVPLIQNINAFFSNLALHHPVLLKTIGLFLLIGTVISGLVFVVSSVALAVSIFVATGLGAIIGPAAAVVAILIGLGAVIAILATHWNQIWGAITKAIQPFHETMVQVGTFIVNMFWPPIKAIADTFKQAWNATFKDAKSAVDSLMPAWNQLKQTLVTAKPLWDGILFVLKWIGIIIGAVLVVAIGFLIAAFHGLAGVIGPVFSGIVQMLTGVIQIVTGFVSVVVGIFDAFIGTIVVFFQKGPTEAGKHFWAALSNVGQGILSILSGIGHLIFGFFYTAFGAVIGFVWGFVKGIIGFFQHLADVLVGHSIIPDMLNLIVNIFKVFGAVAGAVINAFVTVVVAIFNILKAAVMLIVTIIVDVFKVWWAYLQFLAAIIKAVFIMPLITVFSLIWLAIKAGIDLVTGNWKDFQNTLTGVYNFINQNVIQPVVKAFQSIWDNIKQGISDAQGFWLQLQNAIMNFFNTVIGPLKDVLDTIGKIFSASGNTAAQNATKGIGQHGVTTHATGYITNGPEFSLIGEGGEREIVAPVSKLIAAAQMAVAGQASGGNITIPVYLDSKQIALVVMSSQGKVLRASGMGRRFR